MTITTLKDLEKLIKKCRSLGVQSIKVDNVEFHLSDAPTRQVSRQFTAKQYVADTFGEVNESTKIETPDELTEDQLLFYSAQQGAQDVPGTF